ncbi:unnamed protein product [Phytophthora lilii]|uniref:Unnamed protein product n=1 Tax=Phytophthora lilii TaxID=2077276 RepID=A0A9W6X570_9STRA|nr:unnamed protein product [Phytophthora lilii]
MVSLAGGIGLRPVPFQFRDAADEAYPSLYTSLEDCAPVIFAKSQNRPSQMKSSLFAAKGGGEVSTLQLVARRCKYYAFINAFICSVAWGSYAAVSPLNRDAESPVTLQQLIVVYGVSLLRILAMIKWFEWIATKKPQINGDKRVQLTDEQTRTIYRRILWLVVPTECVSFWFAEKSVAPIEDKMDWLLFLTEYIVFIPKSLVFEVSFDFFHFAMHWVCHYSTWLYKNVHKRHHLHLHPCPLSTYEQDGFDLCLTNVLPFCLAWSMGFPFSDLQLHLLFAYKTYVEVAGHSGLEIKGFSFPQMPLLNNVTTFVSFWIATVMTYVQLKHIVAAMPLTIVQITGISAIIASVTVSLMYLLALHIGFPLPVSSNSTTCMVTPRYSTCFVDEKSSN